MATLNSPPTPPIAPARIQLGTFSGVFMPSFLTIMGVIIFLRMGFVMGNAGLVEGMTIVLLANAISILTSLSVSAIATNIRVKGGGVYYLISRSLGPEYGAPIGLVLFLSQAVSVSFYIIGFTEIVVAIIPFLEPFTLFVEYGLCFGLFILAILGLDWASRVQYWILGVLVVGLLSFVIGALAEFSVPMVKVNMAADYLPRLSFWGVFAIYFPAITGFTQGVSLSGDLKNPEKSIPVGTLWAVFSSLVIYVVFAVLVLGAVPRQNLLNNYLVMKDVSLVPFFIDIGVMGATLSSALTSFLGAPRILQALARDKVFPLIRPLARGSGPSRIPRRATFLTFLVAFLGIMNGNLNTIAPIVTMFFLLTYGLMNYATFVEDFSNNPSFRPRFRWFHYRLSFAGAALCVLFMLFIHALAAVLAFALVFILYWTVEKTTREKSWGDAQRGFFFSKIREYLLRLRDEPFHKKNWRPQMLVLCGKPSSRKPLVKVASWLESGRGVITLANIIPGTLEDKLPLRNHELASFREFAVKSEMPVFWEVMVAPTYRDGVESLVQCHSIGRIKPNTVLMGWAEQRENQVALVDVCQSLAQLGKNIVLIDDEEGLFRDEENLELKDLVVDVWWRGDQNGPLMLLLAYLWTQNPECREGRIRLCRLVAKEEEKEKAEKELYDMIQGARIEAQVRVFLTTEPWLEAIPKYSRGADVVFLGLHIPFKGDEDWFINTYGPLVKKLPTAVLVKSMEDLDVHA